MFKSLKATLMLWVVVLIVVLVPMRLYFELRTLLHRTDAAYDVTLSDWALALGNLLHMRDGQVHFDLNEQTEQSLRTSSTTDSIYYTVLDAQGQRLAGDAPLAHGHMPLKRGERRIINTKLDGKAVRMAVHAVPCGDGLCQVRVAETLGKRLEARREAFSSALTSALMFGVVLAMAIWLVVARSMRPLASVNEQLAQRSLDDLSPLKLGHVPSEIRPLVDAVVQLLQRVSEDAARQRNFIADAAHQLRTPLTALHTEAELALLEPHPPSVHATLEGLRRSSQRVARLADQLLTMARTEASTRRASATDVFDLKLVAQDAAQDWVPRALRRGADLGFQLESATVRGQRHLIGEVLANLLHNALEYAAADPQRAARITVRTGRMAQDASAAGRPGLAPVLEVEDNGPGIEPEQRTRVLERFYRAPGSRGSGSGLGLAIVADIAATHGARIELLDAEEGPGLRVRITFPSPEAAPGGPASAGAETA